MSTNAKTHVMEVLSEISLLRNKVFDNKVKRDTSLPTVVIKKVASDDFGYVDDPFRDTISIIRLDIRAKDRKQRDFLEEEIFEAINGGGRCAGKDTHFEGEEQDIEGNKSTSYLLTLQYRIMET